MLLSHLPCLPILLTCFALQVIDRAYLSQEQSPLASVGSVPAKSPQPLPAGGAQASASVNAVATASVEICISNTTPSAVILQPATTISADGDLASNNHLP